MDLDIRDILREFIKGIENQSITLRYINFKANTDIEGSFSEGSLERTLELHKVTVKMADIESTFERESRIRALIVEYQGVYKDTLVLDKEHFERFGREKVVLVSAEFAYEIKLHLNNENIFLKLEDRERERVLKAFVENSGKLMLFPYLRHLLHILSFESGINLPPLKPILIK